MSDNISSPPRSHLTHFVQHTLKHRLASAVAARRRRGITSTSRASARRIIVAYSPGI
jgi:hypothetical protein